MFTGDEPRRNSPPSSCHNREFKRSHAQLEGENATIPEANENIVTLADETLGALLNSVLREKRQALLRSPQVLEFLYSREQALQQQHLSSRQELAPPQHQQQQQKELSHQQKSVELLEGQPSLHEQHRGESVSQKDGENQLHQRQQQQQQQQQQFLFEAIRPTLGSRLASN